MNAEALAVVRRLKLLVVILVISNLVLGAVSFHFMRKIDADFSELIDRSLPTINNLRGMTSESSLTHRSLTFALSAQQPERREDYLKAADQGLVQGDKYIAEVSPILSAELGRETVARLQAAYARYRQQSSALITLLREGTPPEANNQIRDMRQALGEFMNLVAQISDTFERRSQDQSDLVSATVRTRGRIVLGLGGWPLAVTAIIACIIATVLVLMIILTHRLGARDDP